MCTSHLSEKLSSRLSSKMTQLLHSLAEMIITGWPDDINDVPCALCPYHGQKTPLQLRMASSFEVNFSSFLHQKGRRSSKQYMKEHGNQQVPKENQDTVCIGLELTQTSIALSNHTQHASVTAHRNQNSCSSQYQPLECPWQLLSADYFHFDGSEYLVVTDYYSKMPIIRRIPSSQCNASKTISVLKELFVEYGIPEVLHTDNGPQFANALFTEFATEGSLTITPVHIGILEAMVKLKQLSRLSKDCSPLPSALAKTHT